MNRLGTTITLLRFVRLYTAVVSGFTACFWVETSRIFSVRVESDEAELKDPEAVVF